MKKHLKLLSLYFLGFVLSIAPILTYFLLNYDKYVKSIYDGVRLASGGIILACVLLLKVIGKLKMPCAISTLAMIFILSYLLNSIIADLMIFSFLALLGEALDMLVQVLVRRERARLINSKIATETAKEVSKIVNTRV
jgi:chromate transport protein ChrA